MPLEDSYMEQLKSSIADYKNTGGRLGGSITAALFLKEFVATDKVRGSCLVVVVVGCGCVVGGWGVGADLLRLHCSGNRHGEG